MISIASHPTKSVELNISWTGCWELSATYEGKPLSGRVDIDWRGLAIAGGEVDATRAGNLGGASATIIVGGRSWLDVQEPRTLVDDRGVLASTVAHTLADSIGQTIAIGADRNLGRYFMRRRESGGQILTRLFTSWHVGTDGITRTGERGRVTAGKSVVVLEYDARERRAVLYADRLDQCLPGAVIAATSRHGAMLVTDLAVTVKGEKERIVANVRAA